MICQSVLHHPKQSIIRSIGESISNVFNRKAFSMIIPWSDFKWQNNYNAWAGEAFGKNSTSFFAIEKIAAKCGEIPLKLFRMQNGEEVEITEHPILRLLQMPNMREKTYSDFVASWVSYLKLAGESYIFTPAQDARSVQQLILIQPDMVRPKFDKLGTPTEFVIKLGSEDLTIKFETGGFFPINLTKTFNPLEQNRGFSPFGPLRFSVQLLNETNRFAVNFIQNRCSPPGLLSTEGTLKQQQVKQLERIIEEKYTGPQNAGRPMVLWGGLKWQSMTSTGKDQTTIIEGREYNDRDISRTLGVPPILLGIPGDSTFNNLLEAKRDFVLSTCKPIMQIFADSLNNWLLDSAADQNLFLRPAIDMLPEIQEWRTASYEKVDKIRFLSFNEKRKLSGFETKEGLVYDDLFVEGNKILASDFETIIDEDIDDSDSEILNETDVDDDEKSITWVQCKTIANRNPRQKQMFRRQVLKIRGQLERRLTNSLKKFFKTQGRKISAKRRDMTNIEEAEQITESVLAENVPRLEKILNAHFRSVFLTFDKFIKGGLKARNAPSQAKQEDTLEFAIQQFIAQNTAKHITGINAKSKKTVVKELREIFEAAVELQPTLFELSERITAVHKKFSLKRAAVIARTETTISVNTAGRSSVRNAGFKNATKEWLSDLRATARPEHLAMNETKIGIDEKFLVDNPQGGVDEMDGPGDPNAPVGQLANCICVEAFDADDVEIEIEGDEL